jgi:hypothetical protein
MAKQDFNEFFLPSAIPDRKAAAGAVAAGSISGFLFVLLFGVISAIFLVRDGGTPTSLGYSITTIVMITVTIGTWKRIFAAPIFGLIIAVASLIWAMTHGYWIAIFLGVPMIGGFWTAMRGIAVLRHLRDQGSPPTQG